MVVLSAAVTTRAGKPLLARQFVEMTRLRIEGLLAAFPKLMGSEDAQHTFIETENVRYVYQPLDQLYLLLITNKASNILEDLDTVQLLSKVVADLGGTSEEAVNNVSFELVFAFDEVITTGGYRENITLPQIRTNLQMESHEEKLHNMIRQSKMDTAREEMVRKSKAIRQAAQQAGPGNSAVSGGMVGIGGGSGGGGGGGVFDSATPDVMDETPTYTRPSVSTPKAPVITSSLSLGGGGRSNALMSSLAAEDNLTIQPTVTAAAAGASAVAPVAAAGPADPVSLVIDEKISVTMNRDGGMESMEVKGALALTANQEEMRYCTVQVQKGANPGFTFQTHPKINKGTWESEGVVGLKDTSAGFPRGRPVGVLRWTHRPSGDSAVPLSINCWPEEEGGGVINVNIEYTLNHTHLALHDVRVIIPLSCSEVPDVASVDGTYTHNPQEQTLIWHNSVVDSSNASGSMEFNIRSRDTEAFFPVQVQFTTLTPSVDLAVVAVRHAETGATIVHSVSKTASADNYIVE